MSYITAIGTANPIHRFTQDTIADFMLRTMKLSDEERRKLKAIFRASGIAYRHSVLEDYGIQGDYPFFSKVADKDEFPTTSDRAQKFQAEALALSVSAVNDLRKTHPSFLLKDVTHLVVISCTGMYAPGLDIDLVKALGLRTDVQRTAINFMGCYAAFNGLKVADAFCKSDPQAKVLVVCTELCSIHFQAPGTDDNLLANALFADGSAAVLVERESSSETQLSLDSFHSDLSKTGTDDMAWKIGDFGFEMRLSSYVPEIIRGGIAALTQTLLNKINKGIHEINHFAIHPGGKKILDAIEEQLGITKEQNAAAYKVLRDFGNMSSATVLFVLKELVTQLTKKDEGSNVLSFAFGPGLTMESMVLHIKRIR